MKYLIEHGVDINNSKNKQGNSLLMIATENGYEKIVKYLVEHGANINEQKKRNSFFMRNIIEKKYMGIIRNVMGDYMKNEEQYGTTAVMIASEKGNKEIVKYLIENGAKIDEKK
jgi:ankyrin repeat protein